MEKTDENGNDGQEVKEEGVEGVVGRAKIDVYFWSPIFRYNTVCVFRAVPVCGWWLLVCCPLSSRFSPHTDTYTTERRGISVASCRTPSIPGVGWFFVFRTM